MKQIDLPGAEPERVAEEVEEVVGIDCSDAIRAAGKSGLGVDQILDAIIQQIPPPKDTYVTCK